jgi:hypothetical protein
MIAVRDLSGSCLREAAADLLHTEGVGGYASSDTRRICGKALPLKPDIRTSENPMDTCNSPRWHSPP